MAQEPRPGGSIADELNRLGRQLGEAARLAWESEDRKRLQTELEDGLRRFGAQAESSIEQARRSEAARQVAGQAERRGSTSQRSKGRRGSPRGLIVGMAGLNRELSRLLDRLGERPRRHPPVPSAELLSPDNASARTQRSWDLMRKQ